MERRPGAPTLEAPGEARRAIAPLAGRLDAKCVGDLRTAISELVTISVAHGATRPLDVSVTLADGAVEGSLDDEGPGTRAIVRARDGRDNSLVLQVIDGLVDEWGTNQGQTRVWFSDRLLRRSRPQPVVTAPVDAELTVAAYFFITPLPNGEGGAS